MRTDRSTTGPDGGIGRLPVFTMLSGIGWLIDFATFNLLVWAGVGVFHANLCGAAAGVSFVFVTAYKFIFRDARGHVAVAVAKYVAWNLVAILVASWAIALIAKVVLASGGLMRMLATLHALVPLPETVMAGALAKIAFTPVTMYANFLAAGYIIEGRFSFR